MSECVVCEGTLEGEDDIFSDQNGDSYCEACWYDENDGVYFCQNCDNRLVLNRDEIAWRNKVDYTDPLCADCGAKEGVSVWE